MNHDQESNAAIELQTPAISLHPLLTMAVTATTASIATTAASYFILGIGIDIVSLILIYSAF
jgi:hypothetical protein